MRLKDYKYVKFGLYEIKEAKTIDRLLIWLIILFGIIFTILGIASTKVEINNIYLLASFITPAVLLIFQFLRNVDKDPEIIIGYIEFNYESIKILNNKVLTEYKREDVQSLKVVFSSIKGDYKPQYNSISADTENGLFNEFYWSQ